MRHHSSSLAHTPRTNARREGSWEIFAWMRRIRDSELPSTTRLVLLTMVTWIDNQTGICFPSLQTIAAGCGLSKSTVAHHLSVAEDAGFLSRSRRSDGKTFRSTVYQAILPPPD